MKVKQLVVFLCDSGDWGLYKKHNPQFEVNDSGLYYITEGEGPGRAFMVLKWSEERNKEEMREKLGRGEPPGDMTKLTWCHKIRELWSSFLVPDAQVFVFVHWHGTERIETMKKPSVTLQEYLRGKVAFKTWSIYSLSSLNMALGGELMKYGRVFDVGAPVIPVSNFDEWLKMYKLWWDGGQSAVEEAYKANPSSFPYHKDGGKNLSKTIQWEVACSKRTRLDSASASSSLLAGEGAVNAEVKETDKPKKCEEEQRDIVSPGNTATQSNCSTKARTYLEKVAANGKKWWRVMAVSVIGFTMIVVSLLPLLLVMHYMFAASFQFRTTRGGVAMLLMPILSAAFAECVLGSFCWMIRRGEREGNIRH